MLNEKPRILIVDDDESTRKTLSFILGNKGFETEMAATGQEALEKARERAFNLAFLDIRLPNMEGVDLIAPLKEIQPAMPVIMITGYASVATAVQALDEGASAYMTKPLDMDGLLATIREALEKQRLIREKRRAESQRDAMLEELRQSEERFRQFFENLPDYSYLISPAGAILDVNRAACQVLGYPKEELMGKPLKSIYAPESLPKMGQLLNGWRETGQLFDEEMVILTRAGDRRTVLLSAEAVRDREGQILHSTSVQMDITERKQAEEALAGRASQLVLLNEIGRQVAAVLDVDKVLEKTAQLVHEHLGFHHVGLYTQDPGQDRLVMRARAGEYSHIFPPDHAVDLGQGMVGQVGLCGETLLANDVAAEPHYVNPYPDRLPTRSELSVPIRIGAEIVGVIDLQSPQLDAFNPGDVTTQETLAGQIAVAINNARLYTDTARRSR